MLLSWYRRLSAWQFLAWVLTILILVGIYMFDVKDGLIRFAVVMAVGALDYFIHRAHTPGYNKWPLSGTITARIVWLVLPFDVPIWLLVTTILVALISKHLLRYDGRHIFNPAAFGLVLLGLITGVTPGWWGDAVPWLVIALGALAVWRVKKHWQVVPFILTYVVLLTLVNPSNLSLSVLGLVPWFFALIMVPEPMTSPPVKRSQIGFGVLVAVLALIFSYYRPLADLALPAALIFSNIAAAYLRVKSSAIM